MTPDVYDQVRRERERDARLVAAITAAVRTLTYPQPRSAGASSSPYRARS
jgi:hypothetical protein